MGMEYDVIVIGLGPAGAHFSYLASKRGYRVLSLDKRKGHGYKACAGGLSPVSVRALKKTYQRIPAAAVERKIRKLRVESHTNSIVLDLPQTEAFTTDRSKFDTWLINCARDAGTNVKEQCKIRKTNITSESVHVQYYEQQELREARSPFLIGAYGVRSTIQKMVHLDAPRFVNAIQCEIPLPQEEVDAVGDTLRLYYTSKFSKQGYVWIFPKRTHLTVGLGDQTSMLALKAKLLKFIQSNSLTRKHCGSYSVNAALIPNEVLSKTYGERIILVGDAAGFSDRISWEGISYALRSAECAATVFNSAYEQEDFSDKTVSEYHTLWKSCFGKELTFSKTLQRILFDEKLDEAWSNAIDVVNNDEKLRRFFADELVDHMSLGRAIARLPLRTKIRLLGRGRRGIRALLTFGAKPEG
jgi:digeranylgeranylglycerophospholipid reductase